MVAGDDMAEDRGTVGPTLGIENRCRSVEVTLQVREMFGDLGRQSAREAEKRRRSRKEMRTRDGMAGDRGRQSARRAEKRCRSRRKCGPGTVWPRTGDGTVADLGRQSAWKGEKRRRSRIEMRTGDGMAGDRGRKGQQGPARPNTGQRRGNQGRRERMMARATAAEAPVPPRSWRIWA